MAIEAGDRVQIKIGSRDIKDGRVAKSGDLYCEGNRLWCTVSFVDNEYNTGNRWGLPPKVTRIACVDNNGKIVWNVQPSGICSNIIKGNVPTQKESMTHHSIDYAPPTPLGESAFNIKYDDSEDVRRPLLVEKPYVTTKTSQTWSKGIATTSNRIPRLQESIPLVTQVGSPDTLGTPPRYEYIEQ